MGDNEEGGVHSEECGGSVLRTAVLGQVLEPGVTAHRSWMSQEKAHGLSGSLSPLYSAAGICTSFVLQDPRDLV